MTTTVRHLILRANALYIGIAGFAGVIFDIRGVVYGAQTTFIEHRAQGGLAARRS